jgi:hypothetical protein
VFKSTEAFLKWGENMPLFDNGLKVGTPILIGLGVLVVAPILIPGVGKAIKPLAKAVLKSGLIFVQKGRELISEAAEAIEDITAEVKAELIAEREGVAAGPQPDKH